MAEQVSKGGVSGPVRPGHLLLALLISIATLGAFACAGAGTEGEVIRLDIPQNATELIERGESVPGIPDSIEASVGDVLVVQNRDRSTQFVAGYPIASGQTLEIPLNRAGSYETSCSVHEDRSIEMNVSD